MKLIKATRHDGYGPIWINPDHIVYIVLGVSHSSGKKYTYIKLTEDRSAEVEESPEMLMDKEYCAQNLLEFK